MSNRKMASWWVVSGGFGAPAITLGSGPSFTFIFGPLNGRVEKFLARNCVKLIQIRALTLVTGGLMGSGRYVFHSLELGSRAVGDPTKRGLPDLIALI